jgi:ABC transporter substrate binding protein
LLASLVGGAGARPTHFRVGVEAGCLASYGITIADLYELSAEQIARLLKGAKPADLPVIQPDKFELVISEKDGEGHDPEQTLSGFDLIYVRVPVALLGFMRRASS